jgi:vitamin B12 transporter
LIEQLEFENAARAPAPVTYQEISVHKSPLAKFVLVPLILAVAGANAAEEDGPDTIVVTATRIPTPESQVASSISVVTADDIAARQIQNLPDLLAQLPGLNVVQSGGPGSQTSIFMRGTNSNHTKVFVDGIDVSDPTNPTGAFDFSQFLTQDIERVEVLRGPQSGLYGSDAIGGVINIITKSGSGPAQFNALAEGGSFDTFNQAVGVSGSLDQFHYAANVEHFHAGETPVTPLYLLAPGEQRIDDYDDDLTASTKLGYDIIDGLDVGVVARYTTTHLRFTGDDYVDYYPLIYPDSSQSEDDARQIYTRATVHSVTFGGAFEQTLGVAYSNLKSSDLSPDDPRSDNAGDRVKIDWQGNIRLASDEKLIIGAEHQRDEISLPISASTKIDSGYAELQSGIGSSFFNSASIRFDDNDRFGDKTTFRLAPAYLIQESGTKLKASLGTGFKAPTLDELFENFPADFFYANPNLRPESSIGWDAGFEQAVGGPAPGRPAPGRPAPGKTLRFGATYFHNYIKNLITDNADFTSYTNVGRAVTDGVESFVAYQALENLTIRLDYTYTQATDDILHEELLRRPKHKVDLNAAWAATQRLNFNASVLGTSSWIDGNRDFTIARLTAPGYVTAKLAGSFDLTEHFAVYARVENLFNHHYEEPIGYLQPTLGAYAGLKAKF